MNTSKHIIVLTLVLFVLACNNKENHSNEDGHYHGNEVSEETEKDHHDEEEILLSQQQFEALQMQIDTISNRNMSSYIEANGTLEVPPQNEASVTSVVGANVVSIEVIEGDKVNKNQAIAYLSHPNIIEIQTEYLNAFSNSIFLKKDFERQKKLYEEGVGSGANFQRSEAEYLASKAMVSGLSAQLKMLNINPVKVQNGTIYQRVALKSPIEGFVQKVEVKTGQYVEPQTELFEIVNTHHIHADLMVFEKDVHKVKKGQSVSFSVQSVPDKELIAEIYSVSKTFEDNPKALHVHAEIKNKTENLIPGMYIQGRIKADTIMTQVFPESAMVKEGERYYAFKAVKENDKWSFEPVEVILGARDGKWVEINFLEPVEPKSLFAMNNAYYLIAEMKKGEAEHSH
ncbi:efflux RND transporter periplasmic adaptor subunit [Mangrovimonas aestuarii]|uniref:efflux RND transporter periplasmic adaptor subunit n=1 Tax=Mangrovimonas aestuarii TaxID=3018443 RepID=UPI0023796B5D|nr:efflux RND transporter periplasmic adaptor subunit [Mangrovimonas aestuarii]